MNGILGEEEQHIYQGKSSIPGLENHRSEMLALPLSFTTVHIKIHPKSFKIPHSGVLMLYL